MKGTVGFDRMNIDSDTIKFSKVIVKPFKCKTCVLHYKTKHELDDHNKTTHHNYKENTYGCYYCNKKFSDSKNAVKHSNTHTEPPKYRCTACEKKYTSIRLFISHVRTHRS